MIRPAVINDVSSILELIRGLAEYEKEPEAVTNTVEGLTKDLFQDQVCEAIVAEIEGKVVGFAIFYTSYSTWKGPCLYLEDLYVQPESRNHGLGSEMFDFLVDLCRERKMARMDWQVLDWNEPAIRFYQRKNALINQNWLNGRMFFPENERS